MRRRWRRHRGTGHEGSTDGHQRGAAARAPGRPAARGLRPRSPLAAARRARARGRAHHAAARGRTRAGLTRGHLRRAGV
ncbi:MAG: hypothetical protein GEU80_09945 [Dehalococcoidia bacterium]|nr:hypothetical protein [Dehalococcoidia bacterium]